MAIPDCHRKENGVDDLTPGSLAKCGYNMISTNDIVSCFNYIITAHCCFWETWHNPIANTYGPKIDRILLKSFKLFPNSESTSTEDVVNFYGRFQELSTSHLLAVMPFNAIMLKNCYEGLCIPGLGTR
jgi:hypothetical protein